MCEKLIESIPRRIEAASKTKGAILNTDQTDQVWGFWYIEVWPGAEPGLNWQAW